MVVMTIHVNIGEAKTQLSKLIAAVMRGERVVLSKAGEPQVEMVPVDADRADSLLREQRMAWIGSGAGKLPGNAGGVFLEPDFTDEELNAFDIDPETGD